MIQKRGRSLDTIVKHIGLSLLSPNKLPGSELQPKQRATDINEAEGKSHKKNKQSQKNSLVSKVKTTKETNLDSEVETTDTTDSIFMPDSYENHTHMYSDCMSSMYLTQEIKTYNLGYEVNKKEQFSTGPSVSYKERLQTVLMIAANKLMGGPHNHVDPRDVEDYKYWKLFSKFNRTLARVYAKGAGLPCYG